LLALVRSHSNLFLYNVKIVHSHHGQLHSIIHNFDIQHSTVDHGCSVSCSLCTVHLSLLHMANIYSSRSTSFRSTFIHKIALLKQAIHNISFFVYEYLHSFTTLSLQFSNQQFVSLLFCIPDFVKIFPSFCILHFVQLMCLPSSSFILKKNSGMLSHFA
jgi:hypothetical protein